MEKVFLLDLRSQDRYVRNGDLDRQTVEQFVSDTPDLSEQTVSTVETQPALGLFDAETLERVQKSFPYSTFNR